MKKTWIDFNHFVKGQKIALFGNAMSVLDKEREIDSQYDIICRMNLGIGKGHEKSIGSRTDVLFLSMPIKDSVLKQLNPKFIIWCTPKHEKMTPYIKERALIYNVKMWDYLYNYLGARPSTGMMAFDIIESNKQFNQLDLYGFDHWNSKTWYTNRKAPCHHNPSMEKTYICSYIVMYLGRIKRK